MEVRLPEEVNWSLLMMCLCRQMRVSLIARKLGTTERNIRLYREGVTTRPGYKMGIAMLSLLKDECPDDIEKCTGQSHIPDVPCDIDWQSVRKEYMRTKQGYRHNYLYKTRSGATPCYSNAALFLNVVMSEISL